MHLEISEDGKKSRIAKFTSDGAFVCDYIGLDAGRAAKSLGVAEYICRNLLAGPKPASHPLTAVPTSTFTTRFVYGDQKREYPTFDAAYAASGADDVVEWGCTRTTCCFDLDYSLPFDAVVGLLRYHSAVWPSSTPGRLHAIYHHAGGYDGIELAAIDTFRVMTIYPDAKIELIAKTRMPPGGHASRTDHQPLPVNEFLEEHGASTWLTDHDLKVGDRIPHTECPVDPRPASLGKAAHPICLREHYVHCYICEAAGVKQGSRHPGRFPYSVLSGDLRPTALSSIVTNMVHYGHAKYIVYATGVAEPVARNLFSGLLKSKHGVDDPRIPSCFVAGEPIGIVRYQGYWSDDSGTSLVLDKSSSILKSLPSSQAVDRKGNAAPNATNLEWLSQPIDLSRLGYMHLTPLQGIQLTQFQQSDVTRKVYKVRPTLNPPRYLPEVLRQPEDAAWSIVSALFPGIDRKVITALIVGRGCSEIRVGLPPMLFLSGSTRVGKTAHTMIAAAMCGDTSTAVTLNADRDRFDNEFLAAKSRSGFVLFDEFFKFAKQARVTNIEAMQGMLKYGNDSMAYKIYIGAVPMGDMPMLIWADTQVPVEVLQHEQIGRRIYHYKLRRPVDWVQSLKDNGLYEPSKIRLNGTDEHRMAYDSIVSWLIDRYFTGPPTDFASVMDELGIQLMNQSEEIAEKNDMIRDLFESVCSRPSLSDPVDKKRWSQVGWKKARSDVGNDPLFLAFSLLQTDRERRDTPTICGTINEVALGPVIGSEHVVLLQVKRHGSTLVIRFVSECGNYTNKELIPHAD